MDVLDKIKAILEEYGRAQYERGRADAIDQLVNVLKQPGKVMAMATSPPPPPIKPIMPPIGSEDGGDDSVIGFVEATVRAVPGQRGRDIVRQAVKRYPGRDAKALNRTVRTALKRLAKRRKVENRNSTWWPSQAA